MAVASFDVLCSSINGNVLHHVKVEHLNTVDLRRHRSFFRLTYFPEHYIQNMLAL